MRNSITGVQALAGVQELQNTPLTGSSILLLKPHFRLSGSCTDDRTVFPILQLLNSWNSCYSCIIMAEQIREIENVIERFGSFGYVADRALATAIYLLVRLGKPLLIEGHAGVGKTEAAKALASSLGTGLIRLQCYEGLDINSAVYEWNYQKQLLAIKIPEGSDNTVAEKESYVFSSDFLLKRPLLQSILCEERSPVLLVDEIDRADEAFEAFLLELLAEFQITIPELGTIQAKRKPHVILTSNSSRELSDALKRRCLYHWIDYPDLEKELEIVRVRLPEIGGALSRRWSDLYMRSEI